MKQEFIIPFSTHYIHKEANTSTISSMSALLDQSISTNENFTL
jgi:hypothetical protein